MSVEQGQKGLFNRLKSIQMNGIKVKKLYESKVGRYLGKELGKDFISVQYAGGVPCWSVGKTPILSLKKNSISFFYTSGGRHLYVTPIYEWNELEKIVKRTKVVVKRSGLIKWELQVDLFDDLGMYGTFIHNKDRELTKKEMINNGHTLFN